MSGDAAAPSGVIHDIGYQHYDGPRLGPRAIQRALYVETLRGAYGLGRSAKSKIAPFAILIMLCLPALIWTLVLVITGQDNLPVDYAEFPIVMQVLISIFLAAQAPAVMSRDLRHRVTSLYFSRPIDRGHYVHAKLAAMSTAVFLLLAVPTTIMFVGALLAKLPLSEQLPDFLRALAGAALYGILLSSIALLVAAFTTRRGLGVAAIVGLLLILSGVQVTIQEIAREVGRTSLTLYSSLLSPFTTVDAVAGHLLHAKSARSADPDDLVATALFTLGWLVMVGLSYLALRVRYRGVSVS